MPRGRPADDVFVGRRDELATLSSAFRSAVTDGCRVVLVDGPPGIGKSALVRRFRRELATGTVVEATAVADEQQVAFGVVDQLLARVRSAPTVGLESDPLRVGAVLVGCLGELAARAEGLVLIVEDVQWADRTSLQALRFALRRLRGDRLLAVFTSRTPVPDEMVRLTESLSGVHLTLSELTVSEVGDLAADLGAGPLTPRAARRLQHHTSGLPLHVRALCRELEPEQLQGGEDPLPAPRSFALLIALRLAGCQPGTADLVAAVAVLGGRSSLAAAAEVGAVADAVGALGEAVAGGLLEELPVAFGCEVRIPHPLIAVAVYQDLAFERRRRLHLRAAEGAEDGAALRHRAAVALGPDDGLARASEEHGERLAARLQMAAAADALLLAARLTAAAEQRAERMLRAVESLLLDGDVGAASAYEAEIAAMADGPRRRLVLGQLAYLSGRQSEAARHLSTGWGLIDRREACPGVAVQLAVLHGQLALLQAEAGEAVRWARRARKVAGADPTLAAQATALLAMAEGMNGKGSRQLALLTDLPDAPRSTADLEGLLARGIVRLWVGDLPGAELDLSAVSEGTSPWRPLRLRLSALACRAKAEYRLGRWDASAAHASFAVSLAEDSEHRWALSFLCSVASLVPAARGDDDAAAVFVRTAEAAAVAGGDLATDRAYAAHAAAHLAFARADPVGVISAIEPVLDLFARDGFAEPGVMPWRELYAAALAAVGRVGEADQLVSVIESVARAKAHPLALGSAGRARGVVQAAAGALDAAQLTLERAGEQLGAVVAPFEQAQLDDQLGRVLRRQGRRTAASRVLQGACDGYAALGATPFLARAERELAACGLTPRRRDDAHRTVLTPQELAVARLVAGGRTNREIATELIVSVKTVEYHLGHVFTKLGVRSRRELRSHPLLR